ncbi:hypothetical protein ACFL5A_03280 [Gemmatimonadota bacterium]
MSFRSRLDRLESRRPGEAVESPPEEVRVLFAMSEADRSQVQRIHGKLCRLGCVGIPLDEDERGRLFVTTTGAVVAEVGEWEALKQLPPDRFPEFKFNT